MFSPPSFGGTTVLMRLVLATTQRATDRLRSASVGKTAQIDLERYGQTRGSNIREVLEEQKSRPGQDYGRYRRARGTQAPLH